MDPLGLEMACSEPIAPEARENQTGVRRPAELNDGLGASPSDVEGSRPKGCIVRLHVVYIYVLCRCMNPLFLFLKLWGQYLMYFWGPGRLRIYRESQVAQDSRQQYP